ncbi:MAG: DUF1667 domain-containing protein [Clostridiales bacterium]|jgi:CxxC motif-containing protein|nr:DUF1667 domain-containing protein [Clostridiales bacterium]
MSKQYICIVCPSSCRLTLEERDGKALVSGNLCKRGEAYCISEHTAPTRMLTSTIKITGGILPRLPVITSKEIPKSAVFECLSELYALKVKAPVACGEVIVKNICRTGADIIASRSMELAECI